ncbi:sulfurtransferase [Alcaligenaceae bacterium]|nr:sulfurtransferase [Alcaligenaceae bacterium]
MKRIYSLMTALAFSLLATSSLAANPTDVPKNKQTTLGLYLSPTETWDIVQKAPEKVLFIDVRTRAEASYVGMADGVDGLVPFVDHDPFWAWDSKRNAYKLEPEQNFISEINRRLAGKNLNKDATIIVMCRSGTRSAVAADRLAEAGFTNVYSVVEGFEGDTSKSGPDKGKRTVNGWKNDGLPWSYTLVKDKMPLEN